MKKTFLLICLLIGVNFFVFSQIGEFWYSTDFEFGNSFVKQPPEESFGYLGAPGFNFNFYQFSDMRNVGMFIHISLLFPVVEKYSDTDYDYYTQYEWIIGPGFRRALSDNLHLHFACGLNMTWPFNANYSKESTDYHLTAVNFGIGGDAGIKYDLSDTWYLNIGLAFAYNFINISTVESVSSDRKTWTRVDTGSFHIGNYALIGIRPYIGIGVNMYGEKAKYGRPPKN